MAGIASAPTNAACLEQGDTSDFPVSFFAHLCYVSNTNPHEIHSLRRGFLECILIM